MSKWEKWYPESGAQTFPLYFGVLESKSDRAKQLYNALNQHYPEWPEKGHWALQANAAVMMGDYQRAERFISSVQELYLKERKWPWRSSEAGFLIAAAHKIRENANLAYQASISSSNKENEVLTLLNDRLLENEFILPGTEKEKLHYQQRKKD